MGEAKIHSLYLQRKDTSSHGPSAYRTVPYAHAYKYASICTSTHLAIRHVYKPQHLLTWIEAVPPVTITLGAGGKRRANMDGEF